MGVITPDAVAGQAATGALAAPLIVGLRITYFIELQKRLRQKSPRC
jgi:hypothetical protein